MRCSPRLALLWAFSVLSVSTVLAQTPTRRIAGAIDDREIVALPGQVHHLARPEFDRGAAPSNLPMERMTLMLQASPEQQAALEQLLQEQQTPGSPNYHRWLTPQEFGARFGISDADLQTVTTWLTSKGFRDVKVANGRRSLEFSGTAAQVRSAFHTEIHNYSAYGTDFTANTADPQIPAALAPVVKGFASLNSYPHKSSVRIASEHVRALDGANTSPLFNTSSGGHVLTPFDFATIYNVTPLWNSGIDGTGVKIAILGRTNFFESDLSPFRFNFGMPSQSYNTVINGTSDVGVSSQGDQVEAATDMEWAGAVAKKAFFYYVESKSTSASDGIDLSAQYTVDNDLADIIAVSYGFCEAASSSSAFYQQLWQQAASQGISVFVSSGDSGSAGCDDPASTSPSKRGLAVSGLASTPYNVAVGGTNLNDSAGTYWNTTNDPTNKSSALGYIPETVWNDSSATSLAASGGGVSSLYPTPLWQTGTGVPTVDPTGGGHHRYLPDVSLAASANVPYYVCALSSCTTSDASGQPQYFKVYGTSVSAPAFAGIQALINQKMGGRQGNPNFYLYPLSTTSGIYHDVTVGTNSVPCSSGAGCSGGKLTGYLATSGYDLATGWGSADVNALVSAWNSVTFQSATLTATASPTTLVHGSTITFNATVSGSGAVPTGTVDAYVVQGSKTVQLGSAALVNGSATGGSTRAPGGSSTLYVRYNGDGVYGSTVSAGIPITVQLEPNTVSVVPSQTAMALGNFTSAQVSVTPQSGSGIPTGTVAVSQAGSQLTYTGLNNGMGSLMIIFYPPGIGTFTFDVSYSGDSNYAPTSSTFQLTYTQGQSNLVLGCSYLSWDVVVGYSMPCEAQVISSLGPAATGSVQFSDNGTNIGALVPLIPSTFNPRTTVAALDLGTLPVGSHLIGAQYFGDANWKASSAISTTPVNIVSKGKAAASLGVPFSAKPGQLTSVNYSIQNVSFGPALKGTVTIFDGSAAIATSNLTGTKYGNTTTISGYVDVNSSSSPLSIGTHTYTVAYTGDASYSDVVSAPQSLIVSNGDFILGLFNPVSVTAGSSTSLYGAIFPVAGLTGPVSLTCTGAPSEATCTVSPTTSSINGSYAVTINTTAPKFSGSLRTKPFGALPLCFAGLLTGLTALPRLKRRAVLLLLSALFTFAGMTSCGGGGTTFAVRQTPPTTITDPGTPRGVYTLTITGTYSSGGTTLTHTTPIQLTVQ